MADKLTLTDRFNEERTLKRRLHSTTKQIHTVSSYLLLSQTKEEFEREKKKKGKMILNKQAHRRRTSKITNSNCILPPKEDKVKQQGTPDTNTKE